VEPSTPNEEQVAFPLPNPSDIGLEKFSEILNSFLRQGGYAKWKMDLRQRTTGPYVLHPSGKVDDLGTHGSASVQVCYSPQVL